MKSPITLTAAGRLRPDDFPEQTGRDYAFYLNTFSHNTNLLRYLFNETPSIDFVRFDQSYGRLAVLNFGDFAASLETGRSTQRSWDEHVEIFFADGCLTVRTPPCPLEKRAGPGRALQGGHGPRSPLAPVRLDLGVSPAGAGLCPLRARRMRYPQPRQRRLERYATHRSDVAFGTSATAKNSSAEIRMIKTAVIGASGFLGRHLLRSYRQSYPDCVGTACSNPSPGLAHFDLRKPDLAALRLEETGHRAVLIASARPNITFCEQQPTAAYAVNVTGTLELLRQIGRTPMSVIFLSSDYVFEGNKGNYTDTDKVKPTTAYGRHKALIEREIPSLVENYLVLRLSKVFGVEKNDGTFLDELARSLSAGQTIQAAVDQLFCPIEVSDLVRVIHAMQGGNTRRS